MSRAEKSTERVCRTCDFWEEWNGVCFNGNSQYCADFTEPDGSCPEHQERKDEESL